MELILVRHGEPLSEERSDGSAADPPLSATGIVQSKAVAKWLCERPADCVLSSPALRARQTAVPTATRLGLAVEIDERLRDAHSNLPDYVTHEEARARDVDGYRSRMASYRADRNMLEVSDRVNESIDEWTAGNPENESLSSVTDRLSTFTQRAYWDWRPLSSWPQTTLVRIGS